MHISKRIVVTAAAAALALTGLAGCGSGGNKGGDTTCGEYKKMDASEQEDVIKAFFKEKGQDNPANAKIKLSQKSAQLYCATAGGDDDPIRNIDG